MKRSAPLRRKTRLIRRIKLRRHAVLRRQRRDYEDARAVAKDRAGGRCEAQVLGICTGTGRHAHHRQMRSQGGPDHPLNLVWACPECHRWIHDNPAQAYELGLLKHRWSA